MKVGKDIPGGSDGSVRLVTLAKRQPNLCMKELWCIIQKGQGEPSEIDRGRESVMDAVPGLRAKGR